MLLSRHSSLEMPKEQAVDVELDQLPELTPGERQRCIDAYNKFRSQADDPRALRELLGRVDPSLTHDEVTARLRRLGLREGFLMPLDTLLQFAQFAKLRVGNLSVEELETMDAFEQLGGSSDKGGTVDASRLRDSVLAFNLQVDIDAMIQEVDEDGSGEIEYNEFEQFYKDLCKRPAPPKGPLRRRSSQAVEPVASMTEADFDKALERSMQVSLHSPQRKRGTTLKPHEKPVKYMQGSEKLSAQLRNLVAKHRHNQRRIVSTARQEKVPMPPLRRTASEAELFSREGSLRGSRRASQMYAEFSVASSGPNSRRSSATDRAHSQSKLIVAPPSPKTPQILATAVAPAANASASSSPRRKHEGESVADVQSRLETLREKDERLSAELDARERNIQKRLEEIEREAAAIDQLHSEKLAVQHEIKSTKRKVPFRFTYQLNENQDLSVVQKNCSRESPPKQQCGPFLIVSPSKSPKTVAGKEEKGHHQQQHLAAKQHQPEHQSDELASFDEGTATTDATFEVEEDNTSFHLSEQKTPQERRVQSAGKNPMPKEEGSQKAAKRPRKPQIKHNSTTAPATTSKPKMTLFTDHTIFGTPFRAENRLANLAPAEHVTPRSLADALRGRQPYSSTMKTPDMAQMSFWVK